MDTQIYSEIN